MDIRVTTDANAEPVLLPEMKGFLKFKDTDTVEDTLITEMIKQSRILLENRSNFSFKEKTLTVLFKQEEIKNYKFILPFAPFVSITTLKMVDIEGTKTELTLNSGYFKRGLNNIEIVLASSDSNFLVGNILGSWDVEVIYITGFGSNTETLPTTWKGLIMKQVAEWYNNREDYNPSNLSSEISRAADSLTNNTWL